MSLLLSTLSLLFSSLSAFDIDINCVITPGAVLAGSEPEENFCMQFFSYDLGINPTLTLQRCVFNEGQSDYSELPEITTRCFNDMIPGPILTMEAGEIVEITYQNNMGGDWYNYTENQIGRQNSTNLHIHGLHLSGEQPGDFMLTVIHPDEDNSYDYTYHIHPDHMPGTFWYHPHLHGSTAVQVGGGAVGMLILRGEPAFDGGQDNWYIDMLENQILLSIVVIHPEVVFNFSRNGPHEDRLFSYTPDTSDYGGPFHLVNGLYQPRIEIPQNTWIMFRISMAKTRGLSVVFLDDCALRLLAKDGVLLHEIPREVSHLWFTTPSRVDVAVFCDTQGDYDLFAMSETETVPFNETIATVRVIGPIGSSSLSDLDEKLYPTMPYYMEDDLTVFGDKEDFPCEPDDTEGDYGFHCLSNNQTYTKNASAPMTISFNNIAGQPFEYGQYLWSDAAVFHLHDFFQINLAAQSVHPLHIHTNHFQVISWTRENDGIGFNYPENWMMPGDHLDTVAGPAVIRFRAYDYGGTIVFHCHTLEHEDLGAMGLFGILGGCDAKDEPIGFIDYEEIWGDVEGETGIYWNTTKNKVCNFTQQVNPVIFSFKRDIQIRLVTTDDVIYGTSGFWGAEGEGRRILRSQNQTKLDYFIQLLLRNTISDFAGRYITYDVDLETYFDVYVFTLEGTIYCKTNSACNQICDALSLNTSLLEPVRASILADQQLSRNNFFTLRITSLPDCSSSSSKNDDDNDTENALIAVVAVLGSLLLLMCALLLYLVYGYKRTVSKERVLDINEVEMQIDNEVAQEKANETNETNE